MSEPERKEILYVRSLSDVAIFTAIFINFFTFFHQKKCEHFWLFAFYGTTPQENINKEKPQNKRSTESHELDVIFTWWTTYTILNILLEQYCLLYNEGQPACFWFLGRFIYLLVLLTPVEATEMKKPKQNQQHRGNRTPRLRESQSLKKQTYSLT